MALSPDELTRYARHIVLRELGGAGQQRLAAASVAVVGAGGLGAPALLYLAAAGVGRITIFDDDTVALSNLQRQVIFETDDLDAPKASRAADHLRALNPHLALTPRTVRLTGDTAAEALAGHDLVLDGCDNFETRYAVNAACVAGGMALVSGAISQWEGQLSVFDPAQGAPCYACIFPKPPAAGLAPSCAEAGVVGALPGVIGSMMALEAIKLITGAGEALRAKLLIFDALWGETRTINIARRSDCAICAARP